MERGADPEMCKSPELSVYQSPSFGFAEVVRVPPFTSRDGVLVRVATQPPLIGRGGQGQRGGLGPHHRSGHIERQRRACARGIRRAPGAAGIGRSRKGRAVLRPFGEKPLRSRGPLPG